MMSHVTWKCFGKHRQKGSAVIEAALLMPWICFLFVGILDSGFYTYAAMATQNAVRAIAIQNANAGATLSAIGICQAAKNELGFLPNVVGMGNCASTQASVSNTTPIWVCAGTLTSTSASVCGLPSTACADCALDAAATSVQAVVTYQSIPLIPIPGILPVQLQLTRIAEARILQ
ncbi:MAG: TadE family protein [Bryobacterales bacterium]|jgi:hypothetical protein|nr:TadE family protein [Bryobacterales bacterium]